MNCSGNMYMFAERNRLVPFDQSAIFYVLLKVIYLNKIKNTAQICNKVKALAQKHAHIQTLPLRLPYVTHH